MSGKRNEDNTEPSGVMDEDISFLDTEPVTFDNGDSSGSGTDDGGRGGKGQPKKKAKVQTSTPAPRRRVRVPPPADSCISSLDTSTTDFVEDLERLNANTDYNLTYAPSHEVKRVYTELLESCQGYENIDRPAESEKILRENIATGGTLFKQMEMSLGMQMNMDDTMSQLYDAQERQTLGNKASDVLMACLHTQACAKMLNQKARRVGIHESVFNVDDYINALRSASENDKEEYSRDLAVKIISKAEKKASRAISAPRTLQGSFGQEDLGKLIEENLPPAPPEKPKRAPRRKDEDDAETEDANSKQQAPEESAEASKETLEAFADGMRKTVRKKCKENGNQPLSVFEVANTGDVHSTLKNLFGIAFIARDGYVEVTKKEGEEEHDNLRSLLLKPEKPPNGDGQSTQSGHRSQAFISFSAADLKKLCRDFGTQAGVSRNCN